MGLQLVGSLVQSFEEELRHLADGVSDQPIVGGVVVGHERHADHHEDDVGDRQIQQQKVDGRPHLVSGQRHADDQQVPDEADQYDDAECCRNGDLVQREVEHQFVFVYRGVVVVVDAEI